MGSAIDTEGLVRFAQRLASIPSVSGDEQAAVEATAKELAGLGFDEVRVDDVGNCVGIIGDGDGPRLLIDGHIDSIPLHSESKWTVDPFGGIIRDDRLFGLGICDQKASIAAAAYGLAAAIAGRSGWPGRVALVASVNEEDLEGAALASVVDSFQPTWAVTTEPSDTRLCIGQRGRAKIAVTITGRACHAGHAAEGLNAAEALAALLVGVREMEQPRHARLGRRDITCIDIASKPYPSVSTVPGLAVARFDCRFLPDETAESLVRTIRSAADRAWDHWPEPPTMEIAIVQAEFASWRGSRFSRPEFELAWWTYEDDPLVVGATAALSAIGLDPAPTYYSFCTNGSYLAGERGIPTIGFGVGEEHIAHQVDEYVTIDSLTKGAAGFAALAAELVGLGQLPNKT